MALHLTSPAKEKQTPQPSSSGFPKSPNPMPFSNGSSIMMLRHMSLTDHANRIEKAIFDTLAEGKHITGDLGGKSSTSEYTKAIVGRL
jgi:isocitrate/isopropylmalate dehydrogenase